MEELIVNSILLILIVICIIFIIYNSNKLSKEYFKDK